jgi:hypothetical protein
MRIYQVSDHSRSAEGDPLVHNNTLYFLNRDRAMREARRLARIHEATSDRDLKRNDVNRFGVLSVWCDRWPDPNIEVRVIEGIVEDAD